MTLNEWRSVDGPHERIAVQLIAEFTGTFALVFVGTGAMITDQLTGIVGHPGVALTFGLVIAAMVYTFREVSAAQFNPAVTVALWLRGVVPARNVIPLIISQIAGASAASILLQLLFSPAGVVDFGRTISQFSPATALALEIVITFVLVTVIMGVVRQGRDASSWAGAAIGGTVALCSLFAGPLTGASMNPARTFGPALVSAGGFESFWIYVAGPLLGAVAAVVLERLLAPGPRGATTPPPAAERQANGSDTERPR